MSFLLMIAFTIACNNDSGNINTDMLAETDDIQTLIETNEYLVQQLSKEQKEVEALNERIDKLESENLELKDNILTYKQQIYELEDRMTEERLLRNELDKKAKDIFEAMNEKNHHLIESIVANNIRLDHQKDLLEIDSDHGLQSFSYITLKNIDYIRQANYEYDLEKGIFVSEYILSSGGKEATRDETIYLTFAKQEDWKLVQISYLP